MSYYASEEDKEDCLDKGDFFLLLDARNSRNNPAFLNMYRAASINTLTALQYHDSVKSTYGTFYNVSRDRQNLTSNYKRHLVNF